MKGAKAAVASACLGALMGACTTNDVLLRPAHGGTDGHGANAGQAGASSVGAGGAVGQLPTGPATKLPPLPAMTHVVATQNDDSASLTFDPVDGALDYRVYPLPADADITLAADGSFTVRDGIYRCAGNREASPTYVDAEPMLGGAAIHAMVDQQKVGGYMRTLADATIGYVYTDPGPGRVPVYALGESDPNADSTCYFARWAASRVKLYTTSDSERADRLARFFRDDGVAFYAPAAADATTATVYLDEDDTDPVFARRWYFPDGPEAEAHAQKTPAFQVLKTAAAGALPLMRVYYENSCGRSHDELAVGRERFNRVYHQGDQLPSFSLLWTGLTGPTTLVVEALDAGCPFQGHLSAQPMPGVTVPSVGMNIVHQPWVTLDGARAASATGEVFINGQAAAANRPRPIARAFVQVAPVAHAGMDFFADFAPGSTPETFTTVPCGADNCFATWRQQSPRFDQMFISSESASPSSDGLFTFGQVMGELWISWADRAGDTAGKYRLTARQKATMSAASFLHVTMEVDAYTTARRYPQLLISDADIPVQYGLAAAHTLVVQARAQGNVAIDYPVNYELQLCKLRMWDDGDPCPAYDLYHVLDGAGKVSHLAPNDEVGEHAGADHRIRFDLFASTIRAYLFLDGQPYGCAELPPGAAPSGPVTVTWGDVLFGSFFDHTFAFHTAHMMVEQRRHFDNLGFSSGLAPPPWDETRLPCAPPIIP